MEHTGSLAGILGQFIVEGQGPEAGDRPYFNDQASTGNQTYRLRNAITGDRELVGGALWPVDTTTFSRSGAANVLYRSM